MYIFWNHYPVFGNSMANIALRTLPPRSHGRSEGIASMGGASRIKERFGQRMCED